MAGDAVLGPLAFFAFRQQHGSGTATHLLDGVWTESPVEAGTNRLPATGNPGGFLLPSHAIGPKRKMPGAGGRAPVAHRSAQEPDEPGIAPPAVAIRYQNL